MNSSSVQTARVVTIIAALALFLAFSACKKPVTVSSPQPPPVSTLPDPNKDFTPRESPIEVAGGSILICAPAGFTDAKPSADKKVWTFSSSKINEMKFDGEQDEPTVTVANPTWEVRIRNTRNISPKSRVEEEEVLIKPTSAQFVTITSKDPMELVESTKLLVKCSDGRLKCDYVSHIRMHYDKADEEKLCTHAKKDGSCRLYIGHVKDGSTFACTYPSPTAP